MKVHTSACPQPGDTATLDRTATGRTSMTDHATTVPRTAEPEPVRT
jgi:hypothetical protein